MNLPRVHKRGARCENREMGEGLSLVTSPRLYPKPSPTVWCLRSFASSLSCIALLGLLSGQSQSCLSHVVTCRPESPQLMLFPALLVLPLPHATSRRCLVTLVPTHLVLAPSPPAPPPGRAGIVDRACPVRRHGPVIATFVGSLPEVLPMTGVDPVSRDPPDARRIALERVQAGADFDGANHGRVDRVVVGVYLAGQRQPGTGGSVSPCTDQDVS